MGAFGQLLRFNFPVGPVRFCLTPLGLEGYGFTPTQSHTVKVFGGKMSEEPRQERRGSPRVRVELQVIETRGEEEFRHPVVYLSSTGMMMRDASFTLDRLMDKTDLSLNLTLPGRDTGLNLVGRIARIEPTDDGELGVGVEFINLATGDIEALSDFVRGELGNA